MKHPIEGFPKLPDESSDQEILNVFGEMNEVTRPLLESEVALRLDLKKSFLSGYKLAHKRNGNGR